jgi:hypothetical protein
MNNEDDIQEEFQPTIEEVNRYLWASKDIIFLLRVPTASSEV